MSLYLSLERLFKTPMNFHEFKSSSIYKTLFIVEEYSVCKEFSLTSQF